MKLLTKLGIASFVGMIASVITGLHQKSMGDSNSWAMLAGALGVVGLLMVMMGTHDDRQEEDVTPCAPPSPLPTERAD